MLEKNLISGIMRARYGDMPHSFSTAFYSYYAKEKMITEIALNSYDKVRVLKYRKEENVHMYECHGYKNYMLWIMAGPVRGFHMTTDPDHKWLNN